MKLEESRVAGYYWQAGDPAHDLTCQPGVAAAIAITAFENSRRFSRGGLEIAGVLLGNRLEAGLSVEQWVPIECEHARGPSLVLSEGDEQRLALSLARAQTSGLQVVGWFISHSRSALALTDSDLEIFERFFPEQWQVTLALKPAADASVRARICSRHRSGAAFGPEFRFDSRAMAPAKPFFVGLPAPDNPSVDPGTGVHGRRLEHEQNPHAAAASQSSSGTIDAPRFVIAKHVAGSARWVIVALASVCLLVAALLFASNLSGLLPRSGAKLGLRAIDTGDQLRVEWNAESPLVQEAQHATVEVNDGGKATKLLLNTNHLRMGSFQFVRHSNDVEFVFTVHRPNQAPVQEWTRFINHAAESVPAQQAPSDPAPPEPAMHDRIRELEEENKRLAAELREETAKRVRQEQTIRILRQHIGFK